MLIRRQVLEPQLAHPQPFEVEVLRLCISARTAQDVPVCWEESPEPADLLVIALTAKTALGSACSAIGTTGAVKAGGSRAQLVAALGGASCW